ncbi:MAG TPA: MFS transporter, partial [Geobacteraceae bacterium]
VSGLIVAIGNLGNLAATAPLAAAIAGFGWRPPFVVMGLGQSAVTLAVFLVVRDRPADQPAPHLDHDRPGLVAGWGIIARTPSFWLLSFLAFCWYGTYMVLQGMWGGPYLQEVLGLTRQAAGNLLLLTALGFVVGCLVIGQVSDQLLRSRKWTLVAGQGLLLLLMSLLLGPAEQLARPLLMAWFFAIGLAVSSGVTIYPMLKEMFPPSITATALTGANFFVLLGAALAQQVMGLVMERFPRGVAGYPPAAYHAAFLFPLVLLALAILCFLGAHDTGPDHVRH